MLNEGYILGVEQFLFDEPWGNDILCSKPGFFCKFTNDTLKDLAESASVSASRILRRIVRMQCYQALYSRKIDE
jgi:hypothetical protein